MGDNKFGLLPSRYYYVELHNDWIIVMKAYDFNTSTNHYIFKVVSTKREMSDEHYDLKTIKQSTFIPTSRDHYELAKLLYE